ncbi:hypothetical protein HYV64_00385 [Candidatus Shapirobacteria bacterium]|nr:hypothetical protein [Candidatus Shapirobacteria bacterium]
MPRVSDVDTIAPDDQITSTPTPSPVKKSVTLKKDKKVTKTPEVVTSLPTTPNTNPLVESVYKILGHTRHPFSSTLIHPHVFDFQERDDDEIVLVVARQHWFTNVRWILISLFMVLFPSLFRFVPTLLEIPGTYLFVGYLFWYLITFAFAFESFLSWYFNVYIITSKRVIDIDFNNLLTKKYSEATIDAIQDVTSTVIGAIPTVFNYGNVLIQTASEVNELEFGRVANPEKIIKVLQEVRDQYKGGQI